jgi:3-phenylpropionate/trans-cinnamate dioxygenase ferredoxin reductase subunit
LDIGKIVILGAGQGGVQTAISLRDNGFDGQITLVGDEGVLPYERPPLSKSYLLGDKSRQSLQFRPEKFYADHKIETMLDDAAIKIDRQARTVSLRSGAELAYDHLVLAVGARNRLLPMGDGLDGILYMRTLSDADALQQRLSSIDDVVVIGAGFIGLETAAVLRKLGKQVTVLEAAPRVMGRAVSPEISGFFADAHAAWGSEIVTNASVSEIAGEAGKVKSVATADGRRFKADAVMVGIGVVPNTEIASAAGLDIDGGIVVDARMMTSDPDISAIGDCASFPCQFANGQPLRLESVQNAIDQAKCVANRLVGKPSDYVSVPWFWSDQGDLKLQMVGITSGADQRVMRGDPAKREFSIFCFSNGKLIGIESVNKPGDNMFGRRLLATPAGLTPGQAADMSFDLKAHLMKATRPG